MVVAELASLVLRLEVRRKGHKHKNDSTHYPVRLDLSLGNSAQVKLEC